MSQRLVTAKKFQAWLESKNPRTKIGAPGDCVACPIAKFLAQSTGLESHVSWYNVSVGSFTGNTYRQQNMPKWAQNFITQVDKNKAQSISASKALSILRKVTKHGKSE